MEFIAKAITVIAVIFTIIACFGSFFMSLAKWRGLSEMIRQDREIGIKLLASRTKESRWHYFMFIQYGWVLEQVSIISLLSWFIYENAGENYMLVYLLAGCYIFNHVHNTSIRVKAYRHDHLIHG